MNLLDILIIAVVLFGLWRGFVAGAMKTALSLISWLAALVAATRLASSVSAMFVGVTDNAVLQTALGFLSVFLVVMVSLQLTVYVFGKTLKALKLDFLDKIAGAVLGAAIGVLKVLVILSITAPLLARLPVWQTSALAPNLLPLAPFAKTLLYEMADGVWQQVDRPIFETPNKH